MTQEKLTYKNNPSFKDLTVTVKSRKIDLKVHNITENRTDTITVKEKNDSPNDEIIKIDNNKNIFNKTKFSAFRIKEFYKVIDDSIKLKNPNDCITTDKSSLDKNEYNINSKDESFYINVETKQSTQDSTVSVKEEESQIMLENETKGMVYQNTRDNFNKNQPGFLASLFYERTSQNALIHDILYPITNNEELKTALENKHYEEYDNLPQKYLEELEKLIKEGRVEISEDEYLALKENVEIYTRDYYENDKRVYIDADKIRYERNVLLESFPNHDFYVIKDEEIDTNTQKLLHEYREIDENSEKMKVYERFNKPRHEFFISLVKELYPDTQLKISRILDTPPHLPIYLIKFHIDDLSFDGKGRDVVIQVSDEKQRSCYIDNGISDIMKIPAISNECSIGKIEDLINSMCSPVTKEIKQQYLDTMLLLSVIMRDTEKVDKFLNLGADYEKRITIDFETMVKEVAYSQASGEELETIKSYKNITKETFDILYEHIKKASLESYMNTLINIDINNKPLKTFIIDSPIVTACNDILIIKERPIFDTKIDAHNSLVLNQPSIELLDTIIKYASSHNSNFNIDAHHYSNRYPHQDPTLLFFAIMQLNYDVTNYLLNSGANVREKYHMNKEELLKEYQERITQLNKELSRIRRTSYHDMEKEFIIRKQLLKIELQNGQLKKSTIEGDGCSVAISAIYREYCDGCNSDELYNFIKYNIEDLPILKLIIGKLNIDVGDLLEDN